MSQGGIGPGPQLPAGRWPSTWPFLWRPVRDRAIFVGGTVLLAVAGTGWLGDLRVSWWVPLLPLVLLIGPLSRPARVRRRFERAADRNRLAVRPVGPGWQLRAPGSRRVVARVDEQGALSYVDLAARG